MKTFKKISAFKLIGLFFVVSVLSPLFFLKPAIAADESLNIGSAITGEVNTAIAINNISVAGTGDDVIPVRLYIEDGTLEMGTTTGITFEGPSSGSTLEFSGLRSNVNAALASLTYTNSNIVNRTLEISLTEPGEVVREENGHLYEVIAASGLTWPQAQAAAEALTRYGSQGYLVTISDADENQYVADRLSQAGWMGASDSDVEGDWKWVTGPEAGTSFWSGGIGGSVVPGQYANWGNNQPDNFGPGEDCGQFVAGGTGLWNDLPCSGTTLDYYVAEFGAPGDLPEVPSGTLDITVADVPSTPDAPAAIAGIESAEVSFSAPTSSGSAITGYRITSTPGGIEATGNSSPITVVGLEGGTEYTFNVVAINEVGESEASGQSNAVTPTSAPQFDDDLIVMPRVGVPYSDSVSASGFPESMTYSVTSGGLPPGLSLNEVTGEITGTPTTPGEYEFEIHASNGVGTPAVASFSGEVATAPGVTLLLEFEVGANVKDNLSVVVSGSGLEPGSDYSVVVESTPRIIASGFLAGDGSFVNRVFIPTDLEPGSHSITVNGTSVTGDPVSATQWFAVNDNGEVVAISAEGPIEYNPGVLPATGSSTFNLLMIALSMLAWGMYLNRNKIDSDLHSN